MKVNKTLIMKLNTEFTQLWKKTKKLENYIGGKEYKTLTEHHQRLLREQYKAMKDYCSILNRRIEDLKCELAKENMIKEGI